MSLDVSDRIIARMLANVRVDGRVVLKQLPNGTFGLVLLGWDLIGVEETEEQAKEALRKIGKAGSF